MLDFSTHPLVEAAWLAEHLSDADVCIVDARWRGDGTSRELYQRGHIPGAVHLDWYHDLSWTDARGVRNLLLPPEPFAAVMASGRDRRSHTRGRVCRNGSLWSSPALVGTALLWTRSGGCAQWGLDQVGRCRIACQHRSAAPFPEKVHTPTLFLSCSQQPQRLTHALREQDTLVRLVDTRPAEQYKGQAIWTPDGSLFLPSGQHWMVLPDQRVMRGGHIPGAVHLHASRLLNPADWTYLPPESIRSLAEGAGLEPGQRVITYCGVGISASLGLFALHLAGYHNVALYDASWEEWGTDPTFPVERAGE